MLEILCRKRVFDSDNNEPWRREMSNCPPWSTWISSQNTPLCLEESPGWLRQSLNTVAPPRAVVSSTMFNPHHQVDHLVIPLRADPFTSDSSPVFALPSFGFNCKHATLKPAMARARLQRNASHVLSVRLGWCWQICHVGKTHERVLPVFLLWPLPCFLHK